MIALALVAALTAAGADELSISHRRVTTADGSSLALYRFVPPGKGVGRPPVLLIADLGFGRELFDFQGRGLARFLAARGRLVFVAELRGQGRAGPGRSLAALVSQDLPAVLGAIRSEHREPIDLIAHGWAGTLALASTARELRGEVRRVVSLNTPALAEPPSRVAEQCLSEGGALQDLAVSPEGAYAFELVFAMGSSFPPRTVEALRSSATRNLGPAQASQLLSWMRSGDLPLDDGSTVRGRLAIYDRPTLQFLALADGFSSAELCSPLREVSGAKVQLKTLSRFVQGDDSSHLSLLLGTRVASDVFAPIEAFLTAEEPR